MNNLNALILGWGPFIVQVVLLSLQIYTYRRTNHYSLVLLAVGTTAGVLTSGLGRILTSEVLAARTRDDILDALVILYAVSMVLGIWGAAAPFQSYRRLTDACKLPTPTTLALPVSLGRMSWRGRSACPTASVMFQGRKDSKWLLSAGNQLLPMPPV